MNLHRLAMLAVMSALVATTLPAARAAEGYANCTGFITTLPTVVTGQGVWCVDRDLATVIAAGNAIEVAANNVTIDCNGFKLGNLAAGTATQAVGIRAGNRSNVRVRSCNIRGFRAGIRIDGTGGGHVIESNRVEGATVWGLALEGHNNLVRNNQFFEIGPSTEEPDTNAYGIVSYGVVDVVGNTISSVEAGGGGAAAGLWIAEAGTSIVRDNTIRGVTASVGNEFALAVYAPGVSLRGNELIGHGRPGSTGIYCTSYPVMVRDNTVSYFSIPIGMNCGPYLDNLVLSPE